MRLPSSNQAKPVARILIIYSFAIGKAHISPQHILAIFKIRVDNLWIAIQNLHHSLDIKGLVSGNGQVYHMMSYFEIQ